MTLLWGRPGDDDSARPARLLLARHGTTDWNLRGVWQGHKDVPLNDLGRAQAGALGARLADEPLDAVWSSDLRRALETAQIVCAGRDLDMQVTDELREIDVGRWEGLASAEIAEREPETAAALARGEDLPRGGAETVAAFQERVVAGFERAARSCPGGTLLLVVHGGVIKVLLAHLLGMPRGNAGRLTSGGNAGLSEVRFGPAGPQLMWMNDTAHTADVTGPPPHDAR